MYILLGLLALAGHGFLWIGVVNRLHSRGIPRWLISLLTDFFFACTLIIPAGIGWLYLVYETLPLAAAVYIVACWCILATTLGRLIYFRVIRRTPAILRSQAVSRADINLSAAAADASEVRHHILTRLPLNEILQLDISKYELEVPRLSPALNDLKVLHLSDLHFTGRIGKAFFREAVRVANELQPDMVCITGDIIDSPLCMPWMADTLGRLVAKHGVYYILGNHDRRIDYQQLRSTLKDLGLVDIGARWVSVDVRGSTVLLGGNELPWLGPFSLDGEAEKGTVPICAKHPTGRSGKWGLSPFPPLRIVLAHSPDQIRWARAHDADLMLAGHTHGGQICIPPFGALFSPTATGVRYVSGVFHVSPTILHVTRGLSGDIPVRWNCRPEIAELRLCCPKTNA